MAIEIRTFRLTLRPLGLRDADELRRMNADTSVMVYVGGVRDRAASDRSIARSLANWSTFGYGRLAVVRQRDGAFLGWVTIEPADDPILVGEIEIGWRLMRSAWGEGFGTEAAAAAAAWAFDTIGIERLVAVIDAENAASVRVAEKIGMSRCGTIADEGRELELYELRRPVRVD